MVRLVVCDLDGTLIDRDEALDGRCARMAAALRQKGVLFTIATGRSEEMAEAYVRQLRLLDIPYILTNGATVKCGEIVLLRKQIPLAPLRLLIGRAVEMGMSVVYTVNGRETAVSETPWILSQRKNFGRYNAVRPFTQSDWTSLMLDKLLVMDDIRDGERISSIEELCRGLPSACGYTRYMDKSVEIVEAGATKASALRFVIDRLGITAEETLTVGDHQNDVEMLTFAGTGCAVSNATAAAKAAADYVCANRCLEGVLEAVQKFCFGGETFLGETFL